MSISKRPIIVIAGKPNTGKSTLFNRLVGARRAITSPVSGVTRDLIEGEYSIGENIVRLFDCGGITDADNIMDDIVSRKSLSIVEKADLILFMVDSRNYNTEDESLVTLFRKYSDKIILVVNKIDDISHDNLLWNFYSLGFERIVGISASHARGIGELEDAITSFLSFSDKLCACDEDAEIDDEENERQTISISILGKPNTGKSTLVNYLTGKDMCLVSDIPGTTRDVVSGSFLYKGTQFVVNDTAGIRRKSHVSEDVEYYSVNRAIKMIDSTDIVFLLLDGQQGISQQDKKIISLVVRRARGIILVLNKIDLFEKKAEIEKSVDKLRFFFPHLSFAPVVSISAKKAININQLLDKALLLYKELNTRIETSVLNSALKVWNEHYSPPRSGGTYFKILYATQVGINPVRFLLFVNKKNGFPEGYISYIKNKIRAEFDMNDIYIDVVLRERERTDDSKRDKKNSFSSKYPKKHNEEKLLVKGKKK